MKLKVIVVDLELSTRAKRAALAATTLAGILLVAGSGAVAAVPHTWNDGDTLNAADLNGAFTALDTRISTLEAAKAPVVTAWTAYTPTVRVGAATTGFTQTTTAFWRRVGDTMEVRIVTAFTSCPTAGGAVYWGLPATNEIDVAKVTLYDEIGSGLVYGPGTSNVVRGLLVTNIAPTDTNEVAVDIIGDGGGGGVCANALNGQYRFNFAVPISGWTTTTP
jgi:hypothetical protein